MPFDVERVVLGVGAIIAGLVLFRFRRSFARKSMAFQNRAFGFRFGPREVQVSEAMAVMATIGCLVWGIAVLLGVPLAD